MTQPLHIKDEHDEGTIHPGQCFSLVFWGMESAIAFGRLTEQDSVEVYILDEDEDDFDKSTFTKDEFLKKAGFNYCDMVIYDIHPTEMTLEDVKSQVKN